jgi:hypothetical protein
LWPDADTNVALDRGSRDEPGDVMAEPLMTGLARLLCFVSERLGLDLKSLAGDDLPAKLDDVFSGFAAAAR